MIEYVYSNMKSIDIQREYVNMNRAGVTHYICDYKPTPAVPQLLKLVGIKCYYRYKIFPDTIETFNWDRFEEDVLWAKEMGFDGFAIDGEAYSNSPIWKDARAKEFGKELLEFVSQHFKCVAIYPEDLGGEKYEYYQEFLDGATSVGGITKFDILMERTYNQEEWYNILAFYLKQLWLFRHNPRVRVFPGVWPEVTNNAGQMWITEQIGKRFYYSETTNFEEGR